MIEFLTDHKYAVLTFLGAILVAYGAFKASVEQKKSEDKAKVLSEQLKAESAEVKRLSELTIQLQNESINELKFQTNMITGGDSFAFVEPMFNVATPNNFDLMLVNSGRYPLYDLIVEVEDLRLLQKEIEKNPKGPINSTKYTTTINVNNMKPKQHVFSFYSIPIPNDGEIQLRVTLSARNSLVVQNIEFTKANTKSRKKTKDEMTLNGKRYDLAKAMNHYSENK